MVDFTETSAIALALDDLHKAEALHNEADPRTRAYILDAMRTLGNSFGIGVSESAS